MDEDADEDEKLIATAGNGGDKKLEVKQQQRDVSGIDGPRGGGPLEAQHQTESETEEE